jgi:hypothetical protein
MAKRKRQQNKALPSTGQEAAPRAEEERRRKFGWIPLWGWILIFIMPLAISEGMFYVAGRIPNMILFPLAWIGFWIIVMSRSGWPILKKRKEK